MCRVLAASLLLFLSSTGCDAQDPEPYEPNILTFEMDGMPYRFDLRPSLDGFVDGPTGGLVNTLGVRVPMGDSGAQFMLRLTSTAGVTPGTYLCGPEAAEGTYVGLIYSADAARVFTGTRGDCSLTVVDVDGEANPRVAGRFSGTVVTLEGERVTLTNGRFHFVPEVIRW
jgi:hypothetical protein